VDSQEYSKEAARKKLGEVDEFRTIEENMIEVFDQIAAA